MKPFAFSYMEHLTISFKDWLDDNRGTIENIMILLGAVLLVFLGTMLIIWLSSPVCTAQTIDIGLPARWSLWGGCQIQVQDGQWIPLNNWRYLGK